MHTTPDPQFQQKIPNLDGGEGCSEYIIHGTNVDISEPQTNVEKQNQEGKQSEEVETSKDEVGEGAKTEQDEEGEGDKGGVHAGGNKTEEEAGEQGDNAPSCKEAETLETATDPRQDGKDTKIDVQKSSPEQAKL